MLNNLRDYSLHIYSEIFAKVYNSPDFEIKKTQRVLKTVENFLNLLHDKIGLSSIGEEWLFEFTVFQFNHYLTAKTVHTIKVNWIFGKKALERWLNRDEFSEYWTARFRQDYNLIFEKIKEDAVNEEYYSIQRKRCSNKDIGFAYCQKMELNTDKNNKECRFCKHKNNCY